MQNGHSRSALSNFTRICTHSYTIGSNFEQLESRRMLAINLREQAAVTFDSIPGPVDVTTADMDIDNDRDVVVLSRNGAKLSWYENLNAQGLSRDPHIIDQERSFRKVLADDLDGDQGIDLLVATYGGIHLFENLDGRHQGVGKEGLVIWTNMAVWLAISQFNRCATNGGVAACPGAKRILKYLRER